MMKTLLLQAFLGLCLLLCCSLAKAVDIEELVRWVPEAQHKVEKSCELGSFFIIVNVKTKKVIASCPMIFIGMNADKVKLLSGKTLYQSLLQGTSIPFKEGNRYVLYRPHTVFVQEHGVVVSVLKPE